MGTVVVDQVGPDGTLLSDVDVTLTTRQKNDLLTSAMPGATVELYAGERVVRFDPSFVKRLNDYLCS